MTFSSTLVVNSMKIHSTVLEIWLRGGVPLAGDSSSLQKAMTYSHRLELSHFMLKDCDLVSSEPHFFPLWNGGCEIWDFWYWFVSIFLCLTFLSLFFIWEAGLGEEAETEILHQNCLTAPNACNNWHWASPKPGTQNSIHVSHVSGKVPITWAIIRCLSGCTLVGSWCEQVFGLEATQCVTGCVPLKQ